MDQVTAPARPRRNTELVLLLLALCIGVGANLLGAVGMDRPITTEYWVQGAVLAILALVFHLVLRLKARYADPYILPIVVTLNGLGIAMIHRIDVAE
ncbi:MAG TPA: FtsW/RodA/SpoVE family cell cycle protein, partial [Citricoccus sp.]